MGGEGATGYGTDPAAGARVSHVGDAPAGEGGVPLFEQMVLPNMRLPTAAVTSALRMPIGRTPTNSPGSLVPEHHFRVHATAEDG